MLNQMNGILNNRAGVKLPVKDNKQSQLIIMKLFWNYETVKLIVMKIECKHTAKFITHFYLAANAASAYKVF